MGKINSGTIEQIKFLHIHIDLSAGPCKSLKGILWSVAQRTKHGAPPEAMCSNLQNDLFVSHLWKDFSLRVAKRQ